MKRLLLAAGLVSLLASSARAADPMTLRFYDISKIVAPHRSQTAPILGPVFQYRQEESPEYEPLAYMEGDAIADYIRSVVDPQVWDAGGDLIFRESGLLIVKAPAATQAKIASLLAGVERGASRRVLFHVDLYELPASRYPDVAAGADPAGLEDPGKKLLESGSVESRPGQHTVLKVTNRVRYVGDYNVEIAQGANISDPVVNSDLEGLAVELVPRPTVDGSRVMVEAVTQSGRFAYPFRTVELAGDEEYLPKPFRSDQRFSNGRLELPTYEETDSSVMRVVPSGGFFTVPVLRGGKLYALRVKTDLLGPPGPAGFLPVLDLSGRLRPSWFGFSSELEPYTRSLAAPSLHRPKDGNPLLESVEGVLDLVCQNVDPDAWENGENQIFVSGDDMLGLHCDDALLAKVRTFLLAQETEVLRPVDLDLRIYSVAGPVNAGDGVEPPAGGTLVGAALLSALPGRSTGVQTGSRAAYIADYDVEVAQEARIADPTIGLAFDGLVANLRPTLSMDRSRLSVEVQLLLARRGPFVRFETGTQYLGPIDHFNVDRTVVNQTIDTAANGVYTIDAGPDPANPTHRLAVVVRNGLK